MSFEKYLDAPTPTLADLMDKHKVTKHYLIKQLRQGIKVEMEHTSDKKVAREIALDHLNEDPDYYIDLAKAESGQCDEGFKPATGSEANLRLLQNRLSEVLRSSS